MHTCFPSPYPEESFYSICARYCDRLRKSWNGSFRDSFGSSTEPIRWDLPHSLNAFAQHLPPWNSLTRDIILSDHTLFPFYRHFLDSQSLSVLFHHLWNGTPLHYDGLFAWLSAHFFLGQYMKYCPSCAVADRKTFGETYWHRSHQIPGMMICLDHHIFLEVSTVPNLSPNVNLSKACVAEREVPRVDPRPFNNEDVLAPG